MLESRSATGTKVALENTNLLHKSKEISAAWEISAAAMSSM